MLNKKHYILAIAACTLFLFSFAALTQKQQSTVSTVPPSGKIYTAGDQITFAINCNCDATYAPTLILKSSYGTIIVSAVKVADNSMVYNVPDFFSRKTGLVHWELVGDENIIKQGFFTIVPESSVTHVENYLGPRSMLTGDRHYTMMVAAPTDKFDNPKPEGTPVIIKSQFLDNINFVTYPVKDFIAWKRLFSPEKSGKLITSIECGGEESKETETDVYPNLPVDFKIGYYRNHRFADGNQLTVLATSEMRDKFGNVVSDGTTVVFVVHNNQGATLKTFGTTINGVAEGKIPAPEHWDIFRVKAFVNGMGESPEIQISYMPVKVAIKHSYNEKAQTLTVGPINSFMGQHAPDGTTVKILLLYKNKAVATLEEYTRKGFVSFKLPKEEYPEKQYELTISILGNRLKTQLTTDVKNK
ncbi:hypothetical protein [Flavobacterium psychrotrophum]|uniref:hypothetical protein n=1 Tax=Flavobacterium psychrotrophum TaxID=2294119 RepID=UPI000E311274|nr:hypothetical protein [Flavobacterium psychrotrophum]